MKPLPLLFQRQLRKICLFVNNHFGKYGKQWNIKTQLEKLSKLTFQVSRTTQLPLLHPLPLYLMYAADFSKGTASVYLCFHIFGCLFRIEFAPGQGRIDEYLVCLFGWIQTCLVWKTVPLQQPSSGLISSVQQPAFFPLMKAEFPCLCAHPFR